MPDSELVPNHGGKNWVTKTGGLPEYISRIAKDLMDKGMPESQAIATAVNTVKRWARGGGKVKPDTRAKAAAALAEWEAKKAASHVGLSRPARLEPASHGTLRPVDLATALDRAAQIADPGKRAAARLAILDLADPVPSDAPATSYNIDQVREAWNAQEQQKRRAAMQRREQARMAAGGMLDGPSPAADIPDYRHVSEVWNTHLIVKSDGGKIHKVPYAVHKNGADVRFGPEKQVTHQYVELAAAMLPGLLATIDLAHGESFGKAQSSGSATTPGAYKHLAGLRNARAARAAERKAKAALPKAGKHGRKRKGAKGDSPKWAHGWVPLNASAKAMVQANPQRFADLRKKLATHSLSEQTPTSIDLAKPGQRYRHGWIRIDGVPVGKSRPKVAGQRGRLTDGLTKAEHADRATRLAAIPRTERTPEQHLAFVRSNAVLRGETPPNKTVLPVGEAARASQAATQAGIAARKARKETRTLKAFNDRNEARGQNVPVRADALPVGQTPGFNGGMTPPRKIAAASGGNEVNIKQIEDALAKARIDRLHTERDRLHTERGQKMWPGLSAEQARYRSVQDWQYRNGQVTVGPNWKAPGWYTGPKPKVTKQGGGSRPITDALKGTDAAKALESGGSIPERLAARSGGSAAKPDKPWSEIHPDYKTTINGVRHVMSGEGGTHLRPWRDPAKASAPSDAMSARTVSVKAGDGGAPMDRGTFKALGIKHGDPIQVRKYDHAAGEARIITGTADVRASSIGVHDGEKRHELGGTATKVMARKVTPAAPKSDAELDPEYAAYENKVIAALKGNHAYQPEDIQNLIEQDSTFREIAQSLDKGRSPASVAARLHAEDTNIRPDQPKAPGAHPEKFKPGEKPPVHKFMNTERLTAIANGSNPEHAAKAKEILAKRRGAPERTSGRQGAGPSSIMKEPSAAEIAAAKAAKTPQMMNPRTPTGIAFSRNPRGGYELEGPDGKVGLSQAQYDKMSQADLQKWADDNLSRVHASQARIEAGLGLSPGRDRFTQMSPDALRNMARDTSSPADRVAAIRELNKRGISHGEDRPVRGGSVPPPRPIGGARGVGSAQAGSSNAQFALRQTIYEKMPELKGKSALELHKMRRLLENQARATGSLAVVAPKLAMIDRLLRIL